VLTTQSVHRVESGCQPTADLILLICLSRAFLPIMSSRPLNLHVHRAILAAAELSASLALRMLAISEDILGNGRDLGGHTGQAVLGEWPAQKIIPVASRK
jgi:hypothetical protein